MHFLDSESAAAPIRATALSTEERDSLWVETAFAENPELAWERGRGSVKNEVLPKIFGDQRLSLER